MVETAHPYTTVYTDGSSTGRWGAGGWAWVVIDGPNAGRHDSGGDTWTTNQRMELQAAHEAVRAISGLLLVVSDSQYVVNCFNDKWWRRWRQVGFRGVKNADIWEPFIDDVLARRGEVKFAWVRGHAGLPGNEAVDVHAKAAKVAIGEAD